MDRLLESNAQRRGAGHPAGYHPPQQAHRCDAAAVCMRAWMQHGLRTSAVSRTPSCLVVVRFAAKQKKGSSWFGCFGGGSGTGGTGSHGLEHRLQSVAARVHPEFPPEEVASSLLCRQWGTEVGFAIYLVAREYCSKV
jgi:hypothetical protein